MSSSSSSLSWDNHKEKKLSFTRFLNAYFGKGNSLAGELAIYFVIFIVIGCIWFAIFEYGLDKEVLRNLQNALIAISFIVGYVYARWLNKSWEGYNDGPNSLLSINNKISNIFPVVRAQMNMKKVKDEETKNEINELLHNLYILLDAQFFYTLRLFISDDDDNYFGIPVNGVGSQTITTNVRVFDLFFDKKQEHEFEKTSEILKEISICSTQILNKLEDCNFLKEKGLISLNKILYSLINLYNDANKTAVVKEPIYQDWHVNFILIVYFIFWFPFMLYSQEGHIMLYSYPFLLFMFVGFYIIRNWLGNPFDKKNPLGVKQYYMWKKEFKTHLFEDYNRLTNETIKTMTTTTRIKTTRI